MPTPPPDPSPVTLLEEIFPGDTNPYGTAFGGKILSLIDRAAGLAASRFAHLEFVTASLDAIEFRAPVHQGEIAEVVARVVYTSDHTCGIRVDVGAMEKTSWQRRPCCEGLVFMVALGGTGSLLPVPRLEPTTDKQRAEWEHAAEVHRRRLAARARGAPPE